MDKITTIVLVVLLMGFTVYNNIPKKQTEANIQAVGDSSDSLKKLTKAFRSIENREDKLLIHKIWTGSYLYLKNCEKMTSTSQFEPVLQRVQESYGQEVGKYPDFTDALSEYLVDVGYDDPKPLTTRSERLEFAEIFKGLMEATKYE